MNTITLIILNYNKIIIIIHTFLTYTLPYTFCDISSHHMYIAGKQKLLYPINIQACSYIILISI